MSLQFWIHFSMTEILYMQNGDLNYTVLNENGFFLHVFPMHYNKAIVVVVSKLTLELLCFN